MSNEPQNAYSWLPKSLATLHQAHWYRQVQSIEGDPGPVVTLNGRPMVNLASNDYLGLASEPLLRERAIAAIKAYGTGATGSRLLSGHRPLHRQLPRQSRHPGRAGQRPRPDPGRRIQPCQSQKRG